MIPAVFYDLLHVANAFLKRKATIGDLRRAVRAAQKALEGKGETPPTDTHAGGHEKD